MNAIMKSILESELAEMESEREIERANRRTIENYMALWAEMENIPMVDFYIFDHYVAEEEYDKVCECDVIITITKRGNTLTEKEKYRRHRNAMLEEKSKKRTNSRWQYYCNNTAKECKHKNHKAVRHSDVPNGKGNYTHRIASFEYFM